jgi:hypothetical protein|tara:strand:- start:408 stop:539 length:132 start_codon:yes stop_codon:yes gene_type:complete
MSVIIYQDHIEIIEKENEELQKEVVALKRKIRYYESFLYKDED